MNQTTRPPYKKQLSSPKSGWAKFYGRIVDAGLLTLPDSSQLKNNRSSHDGTSYVVEVKKNGVYRTYSYLNPDVQTWAEAKKMLKIADTLYSEFGIVR